MEVDTRTRSRAHRSPGADRGAGTAKHRTTGEVRPQECGNDDEDDDDDHYHTKEKIIIEHTRSHAICHTTYPAGSVWA